MSTLSTSIGATLAAPPGDVDLVCLSHLRWNFVFQRPQHLLSRAARERRVFFFEEPVFGSEIPRLDTARDDSGVVVAVPHLPDGLSHDHVTHELRGLLDGLLTVESIDRFVLWYYAPMAWSFSHHLDPAVTVFDCMDELSAFAGAPQGLRDAERAVMAAADVMFTGGHSLYEAKKHLHGNVHAFPSSVDVEHFARARREAADPADQAGIPHPRLGFFGVLDERFDIPLVRDVAAARPEWQIVLLGPVVKIDPATLPRAANIHYLGPKTYAQLPDYIAGWDVALLPFARNESTRFISPTKTPEYLAAGRPVVSTSIRDVVRPYEELGLARIADTPDAFIEAVEAALAEPASRRLPVADAFLARQSWDLTWRQMSRAIARAYDRRLARETTTEVKADLTGLDPASATA
ncbi:MAG TPA: glycosyltransferase family 1 protein [Vicinamibacterales bacterium]